MMLSLLPILQEVEHAAESGLPAPFSPTVGLFIWTWVVFVLLLIVLSKYVYPVIVRATADREATIARQLAEAKQFHADAQAALEEQRQQLASARGEANAIIADARSAAEHERAAATTRTRAEQEEILTRARQEIIVERDRAKAELRREAVDLAIAAAGKVIGHNLSHDADRKMVEAYLDKIGHSV